MYYIIKQEHSTAKTYEHNCLIASVIYIAAKFGVFFIRIMAANNVVVV